MHLLAIETSSARGGIALFSGVDLIEEAEFPEGLVHGREVNAHIDRLLKRHRLAPAALGDGAIAVSAGPGSYTGIRVGVTAAKTLALALGAAVVPVPSLEVIAANAAGPGLAAVMVDGKQGHIYCGVFRIERDPGAGNGALRPARLLEDQVLDRRAGAGGLDPAGNPAPEVLVIGDGADLFLERSPAYPPRWVRGPREWDRPRAARLGALARRRLDAGEAVRSLSAIHRIAPIYLRLSEAERRHPGPRAEGSRAAAEEGRS